jgi:hypothetical protein
LEWSINATTDSALGVPRLADLCYRGVDRKRLTHGQNDAIDIAVIVGNSIRLASEVESGDALG